MGKPSPPFKIYCLLITHGLLITHFHPFEEHEWMYHGDWAAEGTLTRFTVDISIATFTIMVEMCKLDLSPSILSNLLQEYKKKGLLLLVMTSAINSLIAAGQYEKAIRTYMLNPLVEFDDIICLALAYLKKGLLQESAK
eukprot:g36937.t1